jgi:glucose/arabinose dehydrogenase
MSLAAWACSSTPDEIPASPTPPDAASTSDVRATPDAPGPSCTSVDLVPGTGPKFCELPGTDVTELTVPPEFCVREFTRTPVGEARVLRFAPNGDLFVAAPSMATVGGASDGPGAIVVLPDDDRDGRADGVLTFAGPSPQNGSSCATLEADPASLACVHGLLFADGYLYFTRSDEVRRVRHAPGARTAPAGPSELVATLGIAGISDARWTHTLEQHKDGSIYVSRGRGDTTACTPEEMTRGAVFALHASGKAALPLVPELVADGFRNPMYLRCAPNSCGDCYASELTGDNWSGVGGREKLALLVKNSGSWGFPCCVARDRPAPGWGAQNCGSVAAEHIAIPIHDTPFGLDFDRGGFPEPYKHGLFVALHGVTTSFGGTGVVWLKTDPVSLRPVGEPKMFIKGFGPVGRTADVVFAPDGRMFIADDTAGRIFWVAPRTLAAPR